MWNFNLLAATRTVEAAMPFMLYRLGICLAVAFACLFAALAGAGTFIAFASFSSKPSSVASFGAALGLAALLFLLHRFRAGLFFNIKAGHLALLARLAAGEKLPQGKAQIELAKQSAAEVFPSSAGFVEIGEAVRAVLRVLPAGHCPYLGKVSNPQAAALLARLAGWAAGSGEQALLALCFVEGRKNPWQAVQAGLLAHLRHYDSLPKNRGFLMAFEYLGLLAAFAAMLYPADSVASMLPVDVGVWRYVFALIFAWSLKTAFLEPIATTALAGLYFDWVQEEGGEAEARALEASGAAFRKIAEKAG
jgi:hypothetical protein